MSPAPKGAATKDVSGGGVERPSARWRAAKDALLREIAAIDKDTPWSEVEPDWWIEMMAVAASLHRHAIGKTMGAALSEQQS